MSRSVYDACGGCRNGQHSRCYAPCDCADGGHVMVGDRERIPSLTQAEVDQLEEGTPIVVLWTGGGGPYRYFVHVDRWGLRYAAQLHPFGTVIAHVERLGCGLGLVGPHPLTRVWRASGPPTPRRPCFTCSGQTESAVQGGGTS